MNEQIDKPICIDLYCGLGGWAEGFLAEGYDVTGIDLEAHDYGTGGYPGKLILRDVRSITGEECKDAAVIVASPPCQEPSYRAMCWKRAKALTPQELGLAVPVWWKLPEKCMNIAELKEWANWKLDHPKPAPALFIQLFNECFRIQREASEAAGRYIPLIVENVRGAQKWVGRAQWHYGSFYLWGDVPAGMPKGFGAAKIHGYANIRDGHTHTRHLTNQRESDAIKNNGGSWFAIGSPGQKVTGQNPDGRKVPGMNWSDRTRPAQGFNVVAAQRYREGVKNGKDWFGSGENCSEQRKHGSRSNSRKAASAMIAKIPFPLAQHIAKVFKQIA